MKMEEKKPKCLEVSFLVVLVVVDVDVVCMFKAFRLARFEYDWRHSWTILFTPPPM